MCVWTTTPQLPCGSQQTGSPRMSNSKLFQIMDRFCFATVFACLFSLLFWVYLNFIFYALFNMHPSDIDYETHHDMMLYIWAGFNVPAVFIGWLLTKK